MVEVATRGATVVAEECPVGKTREGCIMLVLSRKKGQVLRIGDDVLIKIIEVRGGVVRLGIEAPDEVPILRGELVLNRDENLVGNDGAGATTRSRRAISACPR